MDHSPAPPLSLKERIAQLQQAASSPLASPSPPSLSSSSSTLGPTSSSATVPSPPQRAPSPQVLARYIQPSTGSSPLKADPAHTSTSSLTARGERPTSPTDSRSSPASAQQRTRPSFAQPHNRTAAPSEPPLRDAEAALSAHLAASPARSRAGSTASASDAQPKPRPPPPPRPSFVAAKRTAPAPAAAAQAPPPPLPTHSSTLSSSPSTAPAPAPLLPPRRASTLSVHSPTATAAASAPSPPLPPRPRAATAAGAAAGTQRAIPPRPAPPSSSGVTRPSATATTARPALVPKPTTHDPLSAAAGPSARAKPYAASSRLGSSSAAASRTSLVSTASSASSSPGASGSSPAWLVPNKPATPLSALPVRPVEAGARRRYEQVFDRFVEAGEDEVEGQVVAGVWRRSGLPEGELRRIWEEVACGETALDGEAFVKGMWAIDEALRLSHAHPGRAPRLERHLSSPPGTAQRSLQLSTPFKV
ncbi:hypothetical protein JCM9279_004513 [Rhodotorula babjevae]